MITILSRVSGAHDELVHIRNLDTTRIIETAGYIPKETQLQMLMQSGKALDAYYDSISPEYVPADELQEPDFDPTAQKGYDFFDFADDFIRVSNQLKASELAEADRLRYEQQEEEKTNRELLEEAKAARAAKAAAEQSAAVAENP